jgi:predicted DNA-binding transcriptional regulator YafY
VDPFGIVCKQAVWYLVARTPAGMRTYRVSRMSGVTPLAVGFERPARFDLAAWWKTTSAELAKRGQRFIATLALSPETAGAIGRWCPVTPAPGAHRLPPAWKAFHVEFEDLTQARFTVQGLGAGAAVLAPRELGDAIDGEFAKLTGLRLELRRILRAG